MGIDVNKLSPWAQKQILDKLRQNLAARDAQAAQNGGKGTSKYRNTPDSREGAEGVKIRFDSQKEARRYDELMLLLKAGQIAEMKLQPEFTLQEAYTTPDGKRIRAIRYRADFSYKRKVTTRYQTDGGCTYETFSEWETVVEDVKSKATKTRVYEIKKKLLREKFGIEITEIE